MRQLSLNARLALIYSAITVVCFTVVGTILYSALTQQVHEQADMSIVMAARQLRRLVAEIDTPTEVSAHRERLITLVLGDPALALRITDAAGRTLVEYDPKRFAVEDVAPVGPDQRVLPENIARWTGADGVRIQAVAAQAPVADGSTVNVEVVRQMVDRAAFLDRYRAWILITLTLGTLAAVLMGYLLVRRALRPLSAIAASARDITALRLDRRIDDHQAPAELEELIQALNAMLQRLQQGFDRVWQFTADLAHDIRTPIGNLRGASEVALARPRAPAEYQAVLASNVEECERIARMIDKVLFLARAENPQFALKRCPFDARAELLRIADYFEGPSAESGIEVRVEGDARVEADLGLFRRAVSNLLANALRYTPRGGAVALRAEQLDREVRVSVTNPGERIAAEDAEKVFERFYRADKARSGSSTSTGLGLAIVRTILELHGGRASLDQQTPGRTRFVLSFPRLVPVAGPNARS